MGRRVGTPCFQPEVAGHLPCCSRATHPAEKKGSRAQKEQRGNQKGYSFVPDPCIPKCQNLFSKWVLDLFRFRFRQQEKYQPEKVTGVVELSAEVNVSEA